MRTTSPLPKNKTNLFFSGVLILTLSNLLIKTIGLMFKIPITNIIGDEGMGYFNSAYTVYVWFYMISTGGLPIAVSILISESRTNGNFREVKRIFNITLLLFIAIGLIGMGIMIFGSKIFAVIIGADPVYMCIIAIAPTLFLICISSAIRGFFQGYQNMLPTAVSQIIEAAGKLILGILLAVYAMSKGYELPMVAAYAISGLTIGVAGGMLFLIVSKMTFKESLFNQEFTHQDSTELHVRSYKKLLKTLVLIAIPITVSASVMSLTNLIDVMIVIRRLKYIGFAEKAAVAMFGNYTSLAVPLFNLPPVLIYPVSYSIIPLIKSALTAGDTKKSELVMTSSLKVAAILMIPCSLGISVLAKPILSIFYKSASVQMAAPLLSILALSSFFVGVLSVSNSILQACGYERLPIISMLAGAVVKLISSFILIGIPNIGMYGTPIGSFMCYLTITVLNFYFMSKHVGITPAVIKIFVRPLLASVVCAVAAILTYTMLVIALPSKFATLGAILTAAGIYGVTIFLIKGIDKNDIILLPKGQKIYTFLHKCKLM